MKQFLIAILFIFFASPCFSQQRSSQQRELSLTNFSRLDSLENALPRMKEDTLKAIALSDLSFSYAFSNAQQGVYYGQQGVQLSQKIAYTKGVAYNMKSLAWSLWALGNYSNALQYGIDALHAFETLKDVENIGQCYVLFSAIYRDVGDYNSALKNAEKGLLIYKSINFSPRISYANMGSIYELQNRLDSANYYTQKAHQLDLKDNGGKWDWIYWILGNIEAKQKHYPAALANYRKALSLAIQTNIYKTIVEAHNGIANVYKVLGNLDSCTYYANEVLQKWKTVSYQKGVLDAAYILSDAYKIKGQGDSTVKYLEFSIALKEKLFNQEIARNIQSLGFNEQLRLNAIERERDVYRNRLKIYGLVSIGLILLVIALALWRNILHRKRAYIQLQSQKAETELQKTKAETTLQELKAAQSQLIQSEKMASLGELTAGIAHEIQNPLNFVNNFSEVNTELIEEMQQEMDKGNLDDARAISNDIKENVEKINHHGKRADSIVKGMLQHSRQSSGKKEPTDINVLCSEYLRLSYHGLRAKDKDFKATMNTDFDESIGKINIIPQDIGRVLLNLYNNAFYAINEKQKAEGETYNAIVTVSTKHSLSPLERSRDGVEIRISDNGNGIPQKIVDKIFQPFFTTKPTGQGTGLGLSLAYDIVKAHGGELKVETIEGQMTTFIIHLSER